MTVPRDAAGGLSGRRFGRRRVLGAAPALLASAGFAGRGRAASLGSSSPSQPLRRLAASRNLVFGSEVLDAELERDPAYRALFAQESGALTPGLEAKWDHVEPGPGRFEFAPLDRVVAFADREGMRVRLHTLVWSLAMPAWLRDRLRVASRTEATRLLARHVGTVCARYAGRVDAWDVGNELSDPLWHRGPEGLTLTPWRQAIGPEYVPLAFELARAADPTARLFLNEDGLEYAGARFDAKRDTYRRLIDGWRRQGMPLDGFGLQTHLSPDLAIDANGYRRFLADLAGFGLEIHLTELDIRDRTLPAPTPIRDRMAAELTGRVLEIALDERAVSTVMSWGLSDRHGYQSGDPQFARPDGLPSRGLPWDAALQPKPMRDAIARAIASAPDRPPPPPPRAAAATRTADRGAVR